MLNNNSRVHIMKHEIKNRILILVYLYLPQDVRIKHHRSLYQQKPTTLPLRHVPLMPTLVIIRLTPVSDDAKHLQKKTLSILPLLQIL
jgi:hypothetical protein